MTTESNFLPEGVSMEQFIANASYEELTQAYRLMVITAQSPDDHTSQEMGAVLTGLVDKITPTLEAEYAENGLPFHADRFRDAVFQQHMQVNGPGMMSGPAPLFGLIQSAYVMAPDIDVSAINDLTATIDESNEMWRAISGTLGQSPNPSAFIGSYVDAQMTISTAERTLAELAASGTAEEIQAAQMDLAIGQAMFERIDAILPEGMRADAEAAHANAEIHEARRLDGDLPYQRIGAATAYTVQHPIAAAPFVWQGVETLGSNLLATPGYLVDLGNMGSGWAFDKSYEGSAGAWIQRNSLAGIDLVTGTPQASNREEADIVSGVAVIGEVAIVVASVGTMAAPRIGATVSKTVVSHADDGARIIAHAGDDAVDVARIAAIPNAMDNLLIHADEFVDVQAALRTGTDDVAELAARARPVVPGTYAPANLTTAPIRLVDDAAPILRAADNVPVSLRTAPRMPTSPSIVDDAVKLADDAPITLPRAPVASLDNLALGAMDDAAPVLRTAADAPVLRVATPHMPATPSLADDAVRLADDVPAAPIRAATTTLDDAATLRATSGLADDAAAPIIRAAADAPVIRTAPPNMPSPSLADDTIKAGDTVAPAAARTGNILTTRTARSIYRDPKMSFSEKVTVLASRGDDPRALSRLDRLVGDIKSGVIPAKNVDATTLRQINGLAPETAKAMTDAATNLSNKTAFGRVVSTNTAHVINHPVRSLASAFKSTVIDPINPYWYKRHPLMAGGAVAAYQANEFLIDNETFKNVADFVTDTAVELPQQLSNGLDKVGNLIKDSTDSSVVYYLGSAFNSVATAIDVVAAPLDSDTTMVGAFFESNDAAPAVADEPIVAAADEPVVLQEPAAPQSATLVAFAGVATAPQTDAPTATAETTTAVTTTTTTNTPPANAQISATDEGRMQEIMESFARSPVGQFLDSIGPWGQMIAFGLAAMVVGRSGIAGVSMFPGMDGLNNGLTGTFAVIAAVIAAPMLADKFHAASHSTAPAPSEVAANALGGTDIMDGLTKQATQIGRMGLGMVQG